MPSQVRIPLAAGAFGRRAFLKTAAAATMGVALTSSLTACGDGSAAPAATDGGLRPFKVALVSQSLAHGWALAAVSLGEYQKNGLAPEFFQFEGNGNVAVGALMAGEIDVLSAGIPEVLSAMQEGAPLKQVGLGPTSTSTAIVVNAARAQALGVTRDSPIEARMAAMRGMTIATQAEGTVLHSLLVATLREYGLDPQRDVTILVAPGTAQSVGLRQGRFDAVFGGVGGTGLELNLADDSAIQLVLPAEDIPALMGIRTGALIGRIDRVESRRADFEAYLTALRATGQIIENDIGRVQSTLKTEWFSQMDQSVFEAAFKYTVPTWDSKFLQFKVSREDWDFQKNTYARLMGKDYSRVTFDGVVAEIAR